MAIFSSNKYWMLDEPKVVTAYMQSMHKDWQQYGSNPVYQMWVRNMVTYYSPILETANWDSALSFMGDQGELVKMVVPQARTLVRQLVSIITKQRLAFQTIAESTGQDIIKETRIGNALANQIVTKQNLDKKGDILAETAAVFGMSFTKTGWRTDRGDIYSVGDSGELIYTGQLEVSNLSPFDVTYDASITDPEDRDWIEVRTIKNRWNMIAQYPQLEMAIKQLPPIKKQAPTWTYEEQTYSRDDLIYVWEVYHKPCPVLPNGRLLVYGDTNTIFYDGDNPYRSIPIEQCCPEDIFGMGYGYSIFSNLLPCQELMDHEFSVISTNHSAFGVQNITHPRGSAINVEEIGGMNFIAYTPQNVPGGGKPEPLQLTMTSPETFKFIDVLRSHMMEMSGINSTLRGNPPSQVSSGTAIATLTTNALEFLNSFSKSWCRCWERTMEHAMKCYQTFAVTPQPIEITSAGNKTVQQTFTAEQLKPIRGVKFLVSSPLMQTLGGRADVADKLMQNGLIKNVQEYFSIIEGNPLQQLYEVELAENDLLHAENEALMESKPVKAIMTDDHPAHIRGHAGLLNDPTIRFNSQRVQPILDHIIEHKQLNDTGDPRLIEMARTGKPSQIPPPPPIPQTPPGPPAIMPQENLAAPEAQPVGNVAKTIEGKPKETPAGPAPVAKDLLSRR